MRPDIRHQCTAYMKILLMWHRFPNTKLIHEVEKEKWSHSPKTVITNRKYLRDEKTPIILLNLLLKDNTLTLRELVDLFKEPHEYRVTEDMKDYDRERIKKEEWDEYRRHRKMLLEKHLAILKEYGLIELKELTNGDCKNYVVSKSAFLADAMEGFIMEFRQEIEAFIEVASN